MKKMLLTITILILTATSVFALDYQTVKETLSGMTKSQKEYYLKSISGQIINWTGSVIVVKKKRGKCEVWIEMDENDIRYSQDVCLKNITCDSAVVYNKGDSISFLGKIL